jgi:hypothetical protein
MKQITVFIMLLICVSPVNGIVVDKANLLDTTTKELLENQNSPIVSVFTVPTAIAPNQESTQFFNSNVLDVLVYYDAEDDELLILQPSEEGIPESLIEDVLTRYKGRYGDSLTLLINDLVEMKAQWRTIRSSSSCLILKDGYCDPTCSGPDLDCYCGDGDCQSFENHLTCSQDCLPKALDPTCGLRKDGVCSECGLRDPDCQQPELLFSSTGTNWIPIGFGVVFLVLLGALFAELRGKNHARK